MAGKISLKRAGINATITVDGAPFMTVLYEWFDVYAALGETRRMYPDHRYADRFLERYYRMSLVGRTDSPGGMEYCRVRREWVAAGKPPVKEFLGRGVF